MELFFACLVSANHVCPKASQRTDQSVCKVCLHMSYFGASHCLSGIQEGMLTTTVLLLDQFAACQMYLYIPGMTEALLLCNSQTMTRICPGMFKHVLLSSTLADLSRYLTSNMFPRVLLSCKSLPDRYLEHQGMINHVLLWSNLLPVRHRQVKFRSCVTLVTIHCLAKSICTGMFKQDLDLGAIGLPEQVCDHPCFDVFYSRAIHWLAGICPAVTLSRYLPWSNLLPVKVPGTSHVLPPEF